MILLSPEIRKVKLDSWHGFISFWLLLPQMRLVRSSRCNAPIDTSFDKAHVPKLRAALSLQLRGAAGPAGTLMRTVGSPSPSNAPPAAGPGVPNAACSLASAACSTSAAVIGLSSSVLDSFDDNFEGLAATKNTPPLRTMSSSHIQQRFFVKCTSQPESIMDPQRPDRSSHVQHSVIRRDLSNLCVIAHLSHSVLFHSAPDAVNNGLVSLDLRSPFSWP